MRLFIAFCFILPLLSYSQDLVPFLKGDKYGYSDLDRKLVVEAVYDDAFFMENGIGVVKKGSQLGAVDKTGKIIADFKYQVIDIQLVNEKNYLVVRLNNLFGLIDEEGTEIIPCEFKDVAFWGEDFVGVNKNSCVIYDKKYKEVVAVEDLALTFNKAQRILYTYNEKEVTRIGSKHVCVIDGKHFDFVTITKKGEANELVYGEMTDGPSVVDKLYQFFIISPISLHKSRLRVEIYIESQSIFKKLLKALIVKRSLQNNVQNSLDGLDRFALSNPILISE